MVFSAILLHSSVMFTGSVSTVRLFIFEIFEIYFFLLGVSIRTFFHKLPQGLNFYTVWDLAL